MHEPDIYIYIYTSGWQYLYGISHPKRKVVFKPSISRGYVGFREGIYTYVSGCVIIQLPEIWWLYCWCNHMFIYDNRYHVQIFFRVCPGWHSSRKCQAMYNSPISADCFEFHGRPFSLFMLISKMKSFESQLNQTLLAGHLAFALNTTLTLQDVRTRTRKFNVYIILFYIH